MLSESIIKAGVDLLGLGRWQQRTSPEVTCRGSQGGEDEIVAKLLGAIDTGSYVDVGASWPIQCSNTYSLYQRGLRGLLIEPLPECWYAIMRDRPGDFLCPYLVSDAAGHMELRVLRDLSSVRPDWPIEELAKVICLTDTLAAILARYPAWVRETCRVCSIDVEGHEAAVLRGIDWATFRPDVFIIEYRKYDAKHGIDLSSEWEPIISGNGYEFVERTAWNHIWRRK